MKRLDAISWSFAAKQLRLNLLERDRYLTLSNTKPSLKSTSAYIESCSVGIADSLVEACLDAKVILTVRDDEQLLPQSLENTM